MTTCPRCERALDVLEGSPAPVCVNPRCHASPFIADDAVIRIVIELRPGTGIVATWWRHKAIGGFDSLRWFHALMGSAAAHVPTVIRAGMGKLARAN